LIEDAAMRPPATLVIGPVVELRRSLDWFERLPLFGRRIVSTRAWEQSDALTSRLRELGAEAIDLPAIEICPAADPSALDNAIAVLEQYDWVVFTSANGVRFFVEHLDRSRRDWRALRAKIAAIGPATQAAVEQLHLKVDLTAVEAVAESLLEEMAKTALQGRRILLARAAVARDVLPAGLRSRGAVVDVVEAYRTNVPKQLAGAAKDLFSAGTKPDWVTFTSSSTVQNFVEATGVDMLSGVKVASIGPITSATARRLGVAVTVEASRYDVDGLVDAILSAETGSV
jgi:uroporphyrinogen III methyltransferase/synthase